MSTKALLEDGPEELAGTVVPIVPPGQELKIPHRGGYEHYKVTTRHEEVEQEKVTVYRWWERTETAE
ncbi:MULTISPECIES: DUF5988 family protein [Streptomyces]|uniref:Uncharacterized protein n=1 Tax=Streptomyces nodosus TaxID=40318 RepID=A0A0B5DJG0_9ACTN|nr:MULTISPECIES: DUF5988 family protein [Streptomyces]AJE41380.1 hypothetical protein SNOD_16045 [Streptomyces nodosus]MBB4792554.1 hypothetical protein [Streptomyces nodosus]MYV46928.1 hypothetical protein [Streptomyces sp. SID2888]QEV39921.1 hypothetical protein CP978_16345 [Streptomyces nodosus]